MMRNAFSYLAYGKCEETSLEISALCVYIYTRQNLSAYDFFEELTVSLQEMSVVPDCIVVVADETAAQRLLQYWQDEESRRETFQSRCEKNGVLFVKYYQFVAWCPNKGLNIIHTENSGSQLHFKLPVSSFINKGLDALVKNNGVAQIAPAGHVFQHPSKTVSKLFIQTKELATVEPELGFLGRCLAMSLDAFRLPELSYVFIDSMGIYAMVREALEFSGSNARIHNFHSYDELSQQTPPILQYAIVISASTTGGMARRLHEEQGFDDSLILTVIDSSRQERHGKILISLDEVDASYKEHLIDGTEAQIELYGEHFSSKAKPPRAVTLGLPHTPRRLADFLEELGMKGILDLNTVTSCHSTSRLVCIDPSSVGTSSKLRKWLRDEIYWSVATATNYVIYANDTGSNELAQHAAELLKEARGSSETPVVLSYADLNEHSLRDATGVLIVQTLAGDGGLLREISRDLREYLKPSIPRHFLAGVGLPQSAGTWSRLRQFLVRNASKREYGFSTWLELPVGADSTATAWQAYAELFQKAQISDLPHEVQHEEVTRASIELAIRAYQSDPNEFFRTSNGEKLELTDGFVFFGKVFKEVDVKQISDATTFATVAAVLQAARDLNNASNQLRPNGYESVVLDPENFLRFNDNLLQACILRAALPSELDYSSTPHHSRLMKEFLLKLFERHAHPYGAAALEFAAAMASGRLRLLASDRKEVRDKAIEQLKGKRSALLGLILLIN